MNFLLNVLQTVALSSVVIGLVWLVSKALGKRIGYGWRKLLWLVLAVRLLVPIPIQFQSIAPELPEVEIRVQVPERMTQAPVPQPMQVPEITPVTNNVPVSSNTQVSKGAAVSQQSPVQTEAPPVVRQLSAVEWIVLVWAAGAVVMLALHFIQYQRMKKTYLAGAQECGNFEVIAHICRLCREMGIRKNIPLRLLNPEVSRYTSPMVFGYLRTYLLLPDVFYSREELDAIGRHELVHYRQKDLWYKLLMLVVCDIYWFNPMFRLMKHMAFHDVEYVCDAKATSGMDLSAKKDYSGAILKTMSGTKNRGLAFTTQFSGNKKNIRERFENIFSSYNRKMGIAMLALVLVMLTVGTACVSLNAGEGTTDGTEPVAEATESVVPESTTSETQPDKTVVTIDGTLLWEPGETWWEPNEVLDELQAMYPDYDINVTAMDGELMEVFQRPPDVIMQTKIAAGEVADITDVLEARGWLEQLDDNMKPFVSDGSGRVYGIPLPGFTWNLVINVDLFRQAGLVDADGVPIFPKTWDEFAQTAAAIKQRTGAAGFCLPAKDDLAGLTFTNMLYNFGLTSLYSYSEETGYSAHLDSEEAIAAMEFVKDLKWKYGVLTEDPIKENYITGYEHLANGTAAMFIGSHDSLAYMTSLGMAADNIAMCPLPSQPGMTQHLMVEFPCFAFSPDATTEQIDVVLTLIELMGYGPTANDATKARILGSIQTNVDAGAPAIPGIHVWNNPELIAYEQEQLEALSNTNMALYQPFFDAVSTPGSLRTVVYPGTSDLYHELCSVMSAVIEDQNADVTALMKKANENWEAMLNMEE